MTTSRFRALDPRSNSISILLTALVAFGPVSTDLYLPSLPDMTRDFGVSVSMVQLTLSIFSLGFAVGMLIYGPLSDRFGRKPVLLAGVGIYVVASFGCLFANDIETLIIARFFQAAGACAGPVIGRAVVRDVYERHEAAQMLSYMASAMALAPAVAPLLGGWLHSHFGWESNFVALTVFGLMVMLATWVMLTETNDSKDPSATQFIKTLGNFKKLICNAEFSGFTLVVACMFGGLFSFISGSSFVVIDVLGVSPVHFGIAFGCVAASYAAGAFIAARITKHLGLERTILVGTAAGMITAGVGAALAWMGIETLVAVIIPIAAFFFCCALTLPNSTAGAISPFPKMAGAASSLMGFLQMGAGALCGYLVGALHDGTTRTMMTMITVMAASAFLARITLVRRVVD